MSGRAFLDTDILIYTFAKNDPRTEAAEALLTCDSVISVQTLNEFVAVSMRRIGKAWAQILLELGLIRRLYPAPAPLTISTHELALGIAKKYRYHIYDSLVIAAALEASCDILYTEDMRDGQSINGLTIRNPFVNR